MLIGETGAPSLSVYFWILSIWACRPKKTNFYWFNLTLYSQLHSFNICFEVIILS